MENRLALPPPLRFTTDNRHVPAYSIRSMAILLFFSIFIFRVRIEEEEIRGEGGRGV